MFMYSGRLWDGEIIKLEPEDIDTNSILERIKNLKISHFQIRIRRDMDCANFSKIFRNTFKKLKRIPLVFVFFVYFLYIFGKYNRFIIYKNFWGTKL